MEIGDGWTSIHRPNIFQPGNANCWLSSRSCNGDRNSDEFWPLINRASKNSMEA